MQPAFAVCTGRCGDRRHHRSVARPAITAVVPTRDRPERLARCLAALERQRASGLEILVIDDGSKRVAEVAAAVAGAPRARLVRVPSRGPAAARNRGVAEAKGALILFTDDDCAPEPGWADALAEALGDGAVAAAGLTETAGRRRSLAAASQQIADYLTQASRGPDGSVGFAPSNNIAARAELISGLRFDEGYAGAGGEDRDWCARLVAAGHTIKLVPEAVVRHHQELSLLEFWRKHAGYGRGARVFRRRHSAPPTRRPWFRLLLVRSAFRRGSRVGALVCLAQVATAAGYLAELLGERGVSR
jgi:GT2 family glycosyltransferase